jgi:hypothetical protein
MYTQNWAKGPVAVIFMEPGELAIWEVECQVSLLAVDKRMTFQVGEDTMSMEKRERKRWKAKVVVRCLSDNRYRFEKEPYL